MEKTFLGSRPLTLIAAAIAIALCSASVSLAKANSQSEVRRAREDRIAQKGKIGELQVQLGSIASARLGHHASWGTIAAKAGEGSYPGNTPGDRSATMESKGNALDRLVQASPASEASPGGDTEHSMGGGMGAGGMGSSMEHGEGTMGQTNASPAASPSGTPMEHHMGEGMGGMGAGGMQGEPGGAQPQATPSAGMGGMKSDM